MARLITFMTVVLVAGSVCASGVTDSSLIYSAWIASHEFISSEMPDSGFICWSSFRPYCDYSGENPAGRAGFKLEELPNGNYVARGYALRDLTVSGFFAYWCEMSYETNWVLVSVSGVRAGDWFGGERDVCDCDPDRGFVSDTTNALLVPGWYENIQAAIDCATEGDTVLVAPGTYLEAIDFLGKSICVKGELGADNTIITYPSTTSSLIRFVNGEDTLATLEGFTVRDVTHTGDGEGVIRLQASSARIQNCRFTNNKDLWPAQSGEAVIRQFNGYLIVEDCYFADNRGIGGAAIAVNGGEGRIQRNTFKNNLAHSNYGGALSIGGVYGRSSFTIEENLFVDNSTGGILGGAIFLSDNDSTVVRGNTFVRNTANGDGGAIGIYYYCAGIRIENNVLVGNAPYAVANNYGSTVTVSGNLLYGNLPSDAHSGAVVSDACEIVADPLFCDTGNGDYHVEACSPCAADNNGCEVQIGAFNVVCSTVYCGPIWRVATDGSDETGNGSMPAPFRTIQHAIDISANGDTVLVADGTYTGDGNWDINLGGKAIAVVSESGPGETVIDCGSWIYGEDPHHGFIFQSAESASCKVDGFTVACPDEYYYNRLHGGGFSIVGSSPQIANCVFEYGGRESMVCSQSSPSFLNCTFRKNWGGNSSVWAKAGIAPEFGGPSSFRISNNSRPSFERCAFLENFTECGTGGALASSNSNLTFVGCEFRNNSVGGGFDAEWGGALSLESSNATFEDCHFEGNHSMERGGAIWAAANSVMSMFGCTFRTNYTTTAVGGGAIFSGSSNLSLYGCIIDGNQAGTAYGGIGGGIILQGGTGQVAQCTFFKNRAPASADPYWGKGAAISASGAQLVVANTLFIGNEGTDVIHCDSTGSVTISCSDIFGNTAEDWVGCIADQYGQNGNFSLDPLFCDTANGNYSLFNFSPCAAANNSCGQLIGAYDVGCSLVTTLALPDETEPTHVVSDNPILAWAFAPDPGWQQTEFEIEIGTDNDWNAAEMWDPEIAQSSDSQVVYAGAELLDGATYFARVKTKLNGSWTPWAESSFRMNSLPSAPAVADPDDGAFTGDSPTLWVHNAADAESDPLQYQYEVYLDGAMQQLFRTSDLIGQQADSTGWAIGVTIIDNTPLFWRCRSWDGYEYSTWSPLWAFYINTTPEAPGTPTVIAPTGADLIIYDMLPAFSWTAVSDPDPLDEVHYRLELSLNQNFTLVMAADNLTEPSFQLADSLAFDTRYWWRVKAIDEGGLFSTSAASEFWTWTLGDVNRSHDCTIGDITLMIDHLFISNTPIEPRKAGDVNGDCSISIGDITRMIDYLFLTGAELSIGCE